MKIAKIKLCQNLLLLKCANRIRVCMVAIHQRLHEAKAHYQISNISIKHASDSIDCPDI